MAVPPIRFAVSLATLAALLAALFAVPVTSAADPGRPNDPGAAGIDRASKQAQAKQALSTAEKLLDNAEPLEDSPSVTMALRDLALLRSALPEDQQARANAILARPTDGGNGDKPYRVPEATPRCSAVVCVHYVTSTADAPSLTDANGNGVPDYVDSTLSIFTNVHNTYVAAGYRAPLSDGTRGGNARPDIYISDIDSLGYYGYCTTDQVVTGHQPAWAYCVVDDDYANIPSNTPLQNLQVTAAHEYFHAVQFGYDIAEDGWFMEATAAWVEDEVYDDVNDNRQYLANSPLSNPSRSFDEFRNDLAHYGVWIFFRYLTERWQASQAGLPTLVRRMWELADARAGAPNLYSIKAVSRAIQFRDSNLRDAYVGFIRASRSPGRYFEEGTSYRKTPLARSFVLSSAKRSGSGSMKLNHLAGATVRYTPAKTLKGAWTLVTTLNLNSLARGGAARVTIKPRTGAPRVKTVKLNKAGDGTVRTQFGHGQVKWVEVSFVNAGTHYRCNQGTGFSCAGRSTDNGLVQKFSARVVR